MFEINGGLKQGCVLAPTLFALYTAAIMNEIPLDAPSVEIRYRLDGGLFKLSRLRFRTKTTLHNFRELQYADDNDTVTQKPQDLQRTADQFNAAYKHFGMDVNTEKTKLLVQHASNRPQHIIPTVQVNTRIVESVPSFSYLASLLSSVATCEDEIQNRIRAAHAAYGRLTERVFENHGLNFQTKVMVFRAVVLSTLLYACETWTLYSRDVKQLEKFEQAKLRQIFRVRWKDKITNNEILTRASLPSIEATNLQHRSHNPPASPTLGWAYCAHATYSPPENYSVWGARGGQTAQRWPEAPF